MTPPRRLLEAWRLAQEAGLKLFQPGIGPKLPAVPGWAALGLPANAEERSLTVLEGLRALEMLATDVQKDGHSVSLVATLPEAQADLPRTRDAAREIVRSANSEILLLGFGLTDGALREDLIAAAKRNVAVTIVGERSRDDLISFCRSWPAIVRPCRFLQMVEPPAGQSALMHAKVIVADKRRALIGSANFTSGGFNTNLELGLQIEGPVAVTICQLIDRLIERKWFEPLL